MNKDIEDEMCELFDFCGCGAPWEVVSYIKKYLTEISKDFEERGSLNEDTAYWMAAYLCDAHGLTEHGTSVHSAWLSELGKKWLEKLKNYEEWEDYEEPKTFYNILSNGGVIEKEGATDDMREEFIKDAKEIGNYFLSREEAERAVGKLKAWKRLKDKGFRFNGVEVFSEGLLEIDGVFPALKGADSAERLKTIDDLHLLFGEEEE